MILALLTSFGFHIHVSVRGQDMNKRNDDV